MKRLLFLFLMCVTALTMHAQRYAVLEFQAAKGISPLDVDGISDMFLTYFNPQGYTGVDRGQLNEILAQQNLQHSDVTEKIAVRIGRINNISKVVLGKVSRLGGGYQVDVRVVDVETSRIYAKDGETVTGNFRTGVSALAKRLASKIAIRQSSPVPARTTTTTSSTRKRTSVETLYGYLKIFPKELGTFQSEPTSVIAQINKQAQHGYNNWRIPTDEELSLLKANNYLGSGDYMTRENRRGIVLLVTDSEYHTTLKEEEQKAFDVVEQMPEYPGGTGELMKYLSTNMRYPAEAEKNGVQGRVKVQFVIEKDGSISEARVVNKVDESLHAEAIRLVKAMPKWNPGKRQGKAVRVNNTLTIAFRLQ